MINTQNHNTVDIFDKKIAVLGLGLSGLGAAKLANHLGARVMVSDSNPNKKTSKDALLLMQSHHIAIETGIHSPEIYKADLWIVSPGIPKDSPIVQIAQEKKIPIISEIEFASWYTSSKIIAITGSNGKTTTAHILYQMLKNEKTKTVLAGNLGVSFSSCVLNELINPQKLVYVLEVSSFQLEFVKNFCPSIALFTNITEDHIDRHHTMEEYIKMKINLIKNFNEENILIYNEDDKILNKIFKNKNLNKNTFSISSKNTTYQINQNTIWSNFEKEKIANKKHIALKGDHNLSNLLAASTCASLLGIKNTKIKKTIESFSGVQHRLEFVAKINNVEYVNDSKATNINSVIVAINAYKKPIVLILGGYNKGADFNQLLPHINYNKIKTLIAYGEAREQIIAALGDAVRSIKKIGLNSAVQEAHSIAKPGDIVLLSPGCASFDQFANFESRGDFFKSIIEKIKIT